MRKAVILDGAPTRDLNPGVGIDRLHEQTTGIPARLQRLLQGFFAVFIIRGADLFNAAGDELVDRPVADNGQSAVRIRPIQNVADPDISVFDQGTNSFTYEEFFWGWGA